MIQQERPATEKKHSYMRRYTALITAVMLLFFATPCSFAVDGTTRAMIVTTLYRMEGELKVSDKATDYYTDVLDDTWYSNAIVWVSTEGLIEDYGNNLFGPNDVMTREQIATIFYRYAQYEKMDTTISSELTSFSDADKVSAWAVEGMEWAVAATLFKGTLTTNGLELDPLGATMRAHTTVLLYRWYVDFAK